MTWATEHCAHTQGERERERKRVPKSIPCSRKAAHSPSSVLSL